MDHANTFETPATYAAARAEYLLLAASSGYTLWRKRKEVRWPVALAAFAVSDVAGYWPGALAFRLSLSKRIAKGYYAAYNVMHSALFASFAAGMWSRFVRPEWALLGFPLHIGLDRGFLGNSMKPFSVAFEPDPHPAWKAVRPQLAKPWWEAEIESSSINGSCGRADRVVESLATGG